MQLVKQPGGHVWVTKAPNWGVENKDGELNIAVHTDAVNKRGKRGQSWMLGQMYYVLGTGLIFAEHVFQGLNRDMFVADDKLADTKKFAVSWSANRDARLIGDKFNPTREFTNAPENKVFVVYISINEMVEDYPDIYGWAEHWTWVTADPNLPGAPIEASERYDHHIWSKA